MLIKIPNSDIKSIKCEGAKEFKPISDVYINPEKIICLDSSGATLLDGISISLTTKGIYDLIKVVNLEGCTLKTEQA